MQDNIERRGFINKDDILSYITEEQIFELVFGFLPQEYDYVASPFRIDKRPGCWFSYTSTGKLKFTDYGNHEVINGIKMTNIDCFDAVQVYFKLKNLYLVLEFIKKHLIDGKNLNKIEVTPQVKIERRKAKIHVKVRPFEGRDQRYWQKYGITSQNLIEDKVFAVAAYSAFDGNQADFATRVFDLGYAYTNFKSGNKKIYRPLQKGGSKFYTNCTADDIGGLDTLSSSGDILLIKKSYKDWRVVKNQGCEAVWFQNEGMIPSLEILDDLCRRFVRILVFFDNDRAGIQAAIKLTKHINYYYPNKSFYIYIEPEDYVTDPSDLVAKHGELTLTNFLSTNNII